MEPAMMTSERRGKQRTAVMVQPGKVRALLGTRVLAAELHDLSACGMGLIVEQRVEPGRLIIVEVFNAARDWWELKTTGAMHCTPLADGRWLVGCSFFRRFTEAEFHAVIGEIADPPAPAARPLTAVG